MDETYGPPGPGTGSGPVEAAGGVPTGPPVGDARPAWGTAPEGAEHPVNIATSFRGRTLRVLLIEENHDDARRVRELFQDAFGSRGELTRVERPENGRAHLLREGSECVLLSMARAGARPTGVQLLRDASPGTPVISLAKLRDESMARFAVQEGAQDYLIKEELTAGHLARSIRNAIERSQKEMEFAQRAMEDPLTGLAGRALLMDRLAMALARLSRRESTVAVLFLDLDRFTLVNERFGRPTGDRLLGEVADRLRELFRPEDTVARLEDDKFVALCEDVVDERDAVGIGERAADSIAAPFRFEGDEVSVSVSVGVCLASEPTDSPEAVLQDAEAAMQRAKDRGRARSELFEEGVRVRAVGPQETEEGLRRAIERNELRLFYQPIVEMETHAIMGFEALLRWEHPDRGILASAEFIPIAEEAGLMGTLGDWVIGEACRQGQSFRTDPASQRPLMLSVNLSADQLAQTEVADAVYAALAESGTDPERLCLEITERSLLADPDGAADALKRLRALGVRLAIDDFGTGSSSLDSLRRFSVDFVKVDRSIVGGADRDPEQSAVVAAVIGMGHALGLKVIAEGVETAGEAAVLRHLGADLAQGYHFAHPQPLDDALALLGGSSVDVSGSGQGEAQSQESHRQAAAGDAEHIDEVLHPDDRN